MTESPDRIKELLDYNSAEVVRRRNAERYADALEKWIKDIGLTVKPRAVELRPPTPQPYPLKPTRESCKEPNSPPDWDSIKLGLENAQLRTEVFLLKRERDEAREASRNQERGRVIDAGEIKRITKERDRALDRILTLERMDREAAMVEATIALRTDFSGMGVYVGLAGLDKALNEALDERDRLRDEVRCSKCGGKRFMGGLPMQGCTLHDQPVDCPHERKAQEGAGPFSKASVGAGDGSDASRDTCGASRWPNPGAQMAYLTVGLKRASAAMGHAMPPKAPPRETLYDVARELVQAMRPDRNNIMGIENHPDVTWAVARPVAFWKRLLRAYDSRDTGDAYTPFTNALPHLIYYIKHRATDHRDPAAITALAEWDRTRP